MIDGNKDPIDIVKEKGLKQQSDPKELDKLIDKVIKDNEVIGDIDTLLELANNY